MINQQRSLRAALLLALGATVVAAEMRLMPRVLAQPPTEEDKKKKEREKQRPPEKGSQPQRVPQPQTQPGQPPRPPQPLVKPGQPPADRGTPPQMQGQPPTDRKVAPPPRMQGQPSPDLKAPPPKTQGQPLPDRKAPPPQLQGRQPPDPRGPAPRMQGQPLPDPKAGSPRLQAKPPVDQKEQPPRVQVPPPGVGQPITKPADPRPDLNQQRQPREQALPPSQVPPGQQQGTSPATRQGGTPSGTPQGTVSPSVTPGTPVAPGQQQQGTSPAMRQGGTPSGDPQGTASPSMTPGARLAPGAGTPGPRLLDNVRGQRQEHVEDGGRRKIIQEPGNLVIVREGGHAIIRRNEADRFAQRPGAQVERRRDGTTETFYDRPDGVRIVTIVDTNGRLLRRFRRHRDGRERDIIDNRRFYRNVGVGVGLGVIGGVIALNLPPPRVTIPRERYIVDYDDASEDDLYDTLDAPPVERLDRAYSLEEVRYNYEVRARVRRIDLDSINFEFGSWEVDPNQYHKLERIVRPIRRLLDREPDAVLLVEGHTDAVGSEEDNLSLSDRRASAVAEVLTDHFGIPPENLVTQGYGEQHLKVDTQEPERLNRRVTLLNITHLMAER